MTADLDLDALTRRAQSAIRYREQHYEGPAPATVVALVERLRAAEEAVERVRAAVGAVSRARTKFDDPHIFGWLDAITRDFSDALAGPGAPASTRMDPESTDDPPGPQNAANEGDA